MMYRLCFLLFLAPTALYAQAIHIMDNHAFVATPTAKTGAAYVMVHNHEAGDDHLIGASSSVAQRVQLHKSEITDDGIAKMVHMDEGIPLPGFHVIEMQQGGIHIMLMGLNKQLHHGDVIDITLTFEKAGDISFEVPVDLERTSDTDHSGHNH